MIRAASIVTAALMLAGCLSEDVAPPLLPNQLIEQGIGVALSATPGEVATHGQFRVELHLTNTRSEPLRLTTHSGCLAVPGIYRGGARTPFEGSAWGCHGAITTHDLGPGETVVRSWTMHATLYGEHPGDSEGTPAPAGEYRVRADFHVIAVDGEPATLPGVEAPLRVR